MAQYPVPPWLQVAPSQFGEAAAAGARIDLGRAQLQEESRQSKVRAAIASQQMAAEAQARQEEMLRKQQEAEISQQYEQAQIGLRSRALDQEQQQFEHEVQQAASISAAQQAAAREIQAGGDPQNVYLKWGPRMGFTGAGLGQLFSSAANTPKLGEMVPVKAPGLTGIRTSSNRIQLVPTDTQKTGPITSQVVLDPTTGKPIPSVFGVRGNVHNIPQPSTAAAVMKLVEMKQREMAGESALPNEPEPASPSTPQRQYQEGDRVRQKSTGKMGTIIGGVPVWDDEEEEEEPETPVAEENAYPHTGLPGTTGFYYSGQNYDIPAR